MVVSSLGIMPTYAWRLCLFARALSSLMVPLQAGSIFQPILSPGFQSFSAAQFLSIFQMLALCLLDQNNTSSHTFPNRPDGQEPSSDTVSQPRDPDVWRMRQQSPIYILYIIFGTWQLNFTFSCGCSMGWIVLLLVSSMLLISYIFRFCLLGLMLYCWRILLSSAWMMSMRILLGFYLRKGSALYGKPSSSRACLSHGVLSTMNVGLPSQYFKTSRMNCSVASAFLDG